MTEISEARRWHDVAMSLDPPGELLHHGHMLRALLDQAVSVSNGSWFGLTYEFLDRSQLTVGKRQAVVREAAAIAGRCYGCHGGAGCDERSMISCRYGRN
jgi:cytochrome c553